MTAGDDFAIFVRECRRAFRATVSELGVVPPKMDMVSRRGNPRKVEVRPVSVREVDPEARIRSMVVNFSSAFVGLVRLFGPEVEVPDAVPCPACKGVDDEEPCLVCKGFGTLQRLVALTAFSVDATAQYAAVVDPFEGVGAWEPAEFRAGDIEGLRGVLFDNWARS